MLRCYKMYSSKKPRICLWMAITIICQLSGNLSKFEITPLPDSYCLVEADNENTKRTLTVYRNLSQSCDLYINPLSSSQMLISVVAGNITSTDYVYVKRMGQLGVCSNRYVAFLQLLQQPCKATFENAAIQLHFLGDITVYIQDVMVEDHSLLECPEDVNQEDIVGAREGQTSKCKQVKGFGSVIQCVTVTHQWRVSVMWEWDSKPISRCGVQCPDNCSCMLTDRQVVHSCSQNIQDLNEISYGFLLYPSNISNLDLSTNGIGALTVKTFISIGKDIRYLDFSSNVLTILPSGSLDYLYNIIYLDFKGNLLVTVDTELFVNLHSLTYLDLSYNALVSLGVWVFTNLHSLTHLELDNNSIVTLDVRLFANLYNLAFLDLDNNALVELDMHIFINLYKLNRLYLINNGLVALDHRTFHELTELRYLFVNKNKINHLRDGTFSNLFLLERLSVAFNRLTFLPFNIFEYLHSLVQLDLSGNRFQTIPQIGHMILLNKFNLFGNPLAKITKNMFSRVRITASVYVDQPEICTC